MKIDVGFWDRWGAKKRNSLSCPIARAIRRKLGPGHSVQVFAVRAVVNGKSYSLPLEARAFVYGFDEGEKVKSFSFELEGL